MFNLTIETLDNLIDIQRQLIDIADRKKEMIIERKIDDLIQINKNEEIIIDQFIKLKNDLEYQIIQHSTNNDTPTSLNDFIDPITDLSLKEKMREKQSILFQEMITLKDKNQLLEHLLKDSLQFVHQMVDQLTKSKQQNYNYTSPMQKQTATFTKGFFDTKA